MTDQRVGRHVRIYEWDEVDINDDMPQVEAEPKNSKTAQADKKAQTAQAKGIGGLFKRKLF